MYGIGERSERFQEAFRRFERVVDVDRFDSYRELWYSFRQWAGKRWRNTERQNRALAYNGEQLRLPDIGMPRAFGHTVKQVKKMKVKRKRKRKAVSKRPRRVKHFSRKYKTFNDWLKTETRTTPYQRRIIRYVQKHPNATLKQARGHGKKKVGKSTKKSRKKSKK